MPSLFDLDQTLEALEPPQLKYKGQVFNGRPLSWKEIQEFGKEITGLTDKGAPDLEFCALAVKMLNAMALPGDILLDVPPHVGWDMVQSFLAVSKVGIMLPPQRLLKPPTSGKDLLQPDEGAPPPP